MVKLFRTSTGAVVEDGAGKRHFWRDVDWDSLVNRDDLFAHVSSALPQLPGLSDQDMAGLKVLPPIASQEVWAAGVTYKRSQEARLDESGGADCYAKIYSAARPELFFKSFPHRVSGTGQAVTIRSDSKWNVPEPELALLIASSGRIVGYTCGNDMSSRDIEGENPLYLPQAKVWDGATGLGPCIYVRDPRDGEIPRETRIQMEIHRGGKAAFSDGTTVANLNRGLDELAGWLFHSMSFAHGAFLLTGTCVVPPNDFTLALGDEIRISIDGVGTLVNVVQAQPSGRRSKL